MLLPAPLRVRAPRNLHLGIRTPHLPACWETWAGELFLPPQIVIFTLCRKMEGGCAVEGW